MARFYHRDESTPLNDGEFSEITSLAETTFEAADGDSNDEEIQALQDFRDRALEMLFIEVIETYDD